MSDLIEQVAEAIWRADKLNNWAPAVYEAGWENLGCGPIGNSYRRMAEAAVAALQLTQETAQYAKYPDEPAPHSRLVSPWVPVVSVGEAQKGEL